MSDHDVEAIAPSRLRVIRRQLTASPLARQHERTVAGRDRRPKPIPWAKFDRRRYTEPALALAFDAQQKLAAGEYGAITLFARIVSALSVHGVPIDLVTAASRIPGDEARHADLALRMATLLAEPGSDVCFDIDPQGLEKQLRLPMTMEVLDLHMVELAAISETLAAALLTGCMRTASDPTLKAFFGTLVADEINHARLGWFYLAWRAPQWSRAERQRVADRAGTLVAGTEKRFSRGRDSKPAHRKAARALGVLDSPAQQRVVRQVMVDEIVPGLDALGLGASVAWQKRAK
jgi:hypothetical protein